MFAYALWIHCHSLSEKVHVYSKHCGIFRYRKHSGTEKKQTKKGKVLKDPVGTLFTLNT